ncbi:coiled-coil domain-containing protein [Flindersiella endophytica]
MRLEVLGRRDLLTETLATLPDQWRGDPDVVRQVFQGVKELADRFHDAVRTTGRAEMPEGYVFDLVRAGVVVGTVTITAEVTLEGAKLLGGPMKQIKEDVGVAQHAVTASVGPSRAQPFRLKTPSLLPALLRKWVPVDFTLGGSYTRVLSKGSLLSMAALRVKVDKGWPGDESDTSFNQAYEIRARFTVSVTKTGNGNQLDRPRLVDSTAKVVLREIDAYRYGLPVHKSAVDANGEVRGTPARIEENLAFPGHLATGIGFGLVRNFRLDLPKGDEWLSAQVRRALGTAVLAELEGTASLREAALQLLGHHAPRQSGPGSSQDQYVENLLNAERQLDADSLRPRYDDLLQNGVRFSFTRFNPNSPQGKEELNLELRLRPRIDEVVFLGYSKDTVAAELDIDMSAVGSTISGTHAWSLSVAAKLLALFGGKFEGTRSLSAVAVAVERANRVRLTETKAGMEFAGWRVPHELTMVVTDSKQAEIAKLDFEGSAELWALAELTHPSRKTKELGAGRTAGDDVPVPLTRGVTPAKVIAENGEVIGLDATRLREVALAIAPWLPADVLNVISSTDFVRSNIRTIAGPGLRFDGETHGQADQERRKQVFRPHTRWNVTVGAELGQATLRGVLDGVLGADINLRLPTTETARSSGSSITKGGSGEYKISYEHTGTRTKGTSEKSGSTRGPEDINLNLERRFLVDIETTWRVQATRVTPARGGLVGELETTRETPVPGGKVSVLLRESEVVDLYGRGVLNLPVAEVVRSLNRWREGELGLARPAATRAALRLAEQRSSEGGQPDIAVLQAVLAQYDGRPGHRQETELAPDRAHDVAAVVLELERLLGEHAAARLPASSLADRSRGTPEWIRRGYGIGAAGVEAIELYNADGERVSGEEVLEQAVEQVVPMSMLLNGEAMTTVLGYGERLHSVVRNAIGTEYPLLEADVPRTGLPGADHVKLTLQAEIVSPDSLAPGDYQRVARRLRELGLPAEPENLGPMLNNLFRHQAYNFRVSENTTSWGHYRNDSLGHPAPFLSVLGVKGAMATSRGYSTSHIAPDTQINIQALFAYVVEQLNLPVRLTVRAYGDTQTPVAEQVLVGNLRIRQPGDFEPVPQEPKQNKSYQQIADLPPDHVGYAVEDGGRQIRQAVAKLLSDPRLLGRKDVEELRGFVIDRGPLAHDGLLNSLPALFSAAGATMTVRSPNRPAALQIVKLRLEGVNPIVVQRAERVRLGQIHRWEEKDGTKIGVRTPLPIEMTVEGKVFATFRAGMGEQSELEVGTWDGWRNELAGDTEAPGVVVKLDYAAHLEAESRVNGQTSDRLRMENAAHGSLYVLVYEKDLPAFEARYGRVQPGVAHTELTVRENDPERESRAPELSLEHLLDQGGQQAEHVSNALRRELPELEPRPRVWREVDLSRPFGGDVPVAPPLVKLTADPLRQAVSKRTAAAERIGEGARALEQRADEAADALERQARQLDRLGPGDAVGRQALQALRDKAARARRTADAAARARVLADDLQERGEAVLEARELVRAEEDPARRARLILEAAVARRKTGGAPEAERQRVERTLLSPGDKQRHLRFAHLRWQRFFPGGVRDLRAAMAEANELAESLGLQAAWECLWDGEGLIGRAESEVQSAEAAVRSATEEFGQAALPELALAERRLRQAHRRLEVARALLAETRQARGEQALLPTPAEYEPDPIEIARGVTFRLGAEILLSVTQPDGNQDVYRVIPDTNGVVRVDSAGEAKQLEQAIRDLIHQDAPAFLRAGRLRLDLRELYRKSRATGQPFAQVVAEARNRPAERAALAGSDVDGLIDLATRHDVDPGVLLGSDAETRQAVWEAVPPDFPQRLADAGFTDARSFEDIARLFGFVPRHVTEASRLADLETFRQVLFDAGLVDFDAATAELLRNLAGELALRHGLFRPEQRRRVLEISPAWLASAVATRPARVDPIETQPHHGPAVFAVPRQLRETLRWIVERYYYGTPIGRAYRGPETVGAHDQTRVLQALVRFGVPYAARLASELPGSRFGGDLSVQDFPRMVGDPNTPSAGQQRWLDAEEASTRWVPHGADGFFQAVFTALRNDGVGVESAEQLRAGLARALSAELQQEPGDRVLWKLLPDLRNLGLTPTGAVGKIGDEGAVGSPLYAHLAKLMAEHYGLRITVCDEAGNLESYGSSRRADGAAPEIRLLRVAGKHHMPVLVGGADAWDDYEPASFPATEPAEPAAAVAADPPSIPERAGAPAQELPREHPGGRGGRLGLAAAAIREFALAWRFPWSSAGRHSRSSATDVVEITENAEAGLLADARPGERLTEAAVLEALAGLAPLSPAAPPWLGRRELRELGVAPVTGVPVVVDGVAAVETDSAGRQHFRVLVSGQPDGRVAKVDLRAGSLGDPHVVWVAPGLADSALARLWIEAIHLAGQRLQTAIRQPPPPPSAPPAASPPPPPPSGPGPVPGQDGGRAPERKPPHGPP